ncbi:malonate--CoA ligase [Aestuariivirga sp.]|uniref:malonate--CoA ligase n=1 Tax=Aestuariivirga sp. TaxID=2650926 RepID=UPI0039E639C5
MAHWNEGLSARNFAELAATRGGPVQRPFLACDDGRSFTFADFWALAGRLAFALKAAGARPGDRIAVQVEKSPEAIALFWACTRGGFVFLPLNTAYTAAEVSYFVEDAEPAVLVVAPQRADALAALAARQKAALLTLDDVGGGTLVTGATGLIEDHPSAWDDLAAILYTSGTTGRSKGAMLSHGNLASNALALVEAWAFTEKDVLIHALPVYHTHGLFVATNTLLLSGGRMLFRRKFDGDDVMRLMPQATSLMGVPTFYTRLLQHPGLTREAVQHMRLFISGSAPLLAETHKEFSARTGHAILERYGMTETSMNTSNPYKGDRRAGTVGMPLPHIAVRVADPQTHTPLSAETDGMIEVKGPNVFKGYWRNPQKTAEDFTRDGWFITGDMGRISADGYVTISGRAKDLVITGGFNVYPKEIELVIDAMPGVVELAVFGVPHPDFGEAVTAAVVANPGAALDEAAMIAALRKDLAAFKCPKRILVLDELPRNAMGKVQKAVLRDKWKGLFG